MTGILEYLLVFFIGLIIGSFAPNWFTRQYLETKKKDGING